MSQTHRELFVALSDQPRRLVVHVGLHKTASSFVQNVLTSRRDDLLAAGVLYPRTGTHPQGRASTRPGAQSGHATFTHPERTDALLARLASELPAGVSTVVLSSEDFTLRRAADPLQFSRLFAAFDVVEVVLVLRRQDEWIASWYKQAVDQYANFERRSFDEFLSEEGPTLLDFHSRFFAWRDLVGPEGFHVLSYDDLAGGAEICRRLLAIAGAPLAVTDDPGTGAGQRYDSVRAIDTVGLRILNSFRLPSRDVRIATARAIYGAAPPGDIVLVTPEIRAGIQRFCAPINERIEREWFTDPVPGFRFGGATPADATEVPTPESVLAYVDRVLELCEEARAATAGVSAGERPDGARQAAGGGS